MFWQSQKEQALLVMTRATDRQMKQRAHTALCGALRIWERAIRTMQDQRHSDVADKSNKARAINGMKQVMAKLTGDERAERLRLWQQVTSDGVKARI